MAPALSFRHALLAAIALALLAGLVPASVILDRQLAAALEARARSDLALAPAVFGDRQTSAADAMMMHAKEFAHSGPLTEALVNGDRIAVRRLSEDARAALGGAPLVVGADGAIWMGPTTAGALAELVPQTRRGEMPVATVRDGATLNDVALAPVMHQGRWVGAAGLASKSGDPSPVTAHGVFRAIEAAARYRWGSNDLHGRTISLQGCGHVGRYLAKELHAAGARLIVTDIDPEKVRQVVADTGATPVAPDDIYTADAQIFAPCALGGIINDETIPKLKVEIVAGGANNQLLEERHGDALEARDILYAPDYVANAGGVINVYSELAGWDLDRSFKKADEIFDTVLGVFELAKAEGIPTYRAADRVAERRLGDPKEVRAKWGEEWPPRNGNNS